MDLVTIERIKVLHPKLRDEALRLYGLVTAALTGKAFCRFDLTLRSFAQQDHLYALGRTVKNPDGATQKKPLGNIVTNAKGGQSFHNYGLAIDYFLVVDKDGNGSFESAVWDLIHDYDGDGKADWMEVEKIFVDAGWEWGGNWRSMKDNPHVQKTFGYTYQQLLDKIHHGEFDKDGHVNL